MLLLSKKDLQLIRETSAVIWKNLESFTGEDRETLEAFCRYAALTEQKHQDDKEKNRLKMQEYRKDPRTADKVRTIAREAQRRHRAKEKENKEG